MNSKWFLFFSPLLLLRAAGAFGEAMPTAAASPRTGSIAEICRAELMNLPGEHDMTAIESLCGQAAHAESCTSQEGLPIFHWTKSARPSTEARKPLRILVFGMIHGDEPWSGSLVRLWAERLTRIEPRNEWRIVPILNPDGWRKKTRTNAREVDLNRNFPTQDWNNEAMKHWARASRKNPRRFPGTAPGSEKETQCGISQIEDFHPDFVIAVHTPYGVLDFDGPTRSRGPSSTPLPWRRLGNFPGSLGRYLWKERGTPVLTIELVEKNPAFAPERYARLQDELSDFAIKTVEELSRASGAKTASSQ